MNNRTVITGTGSYIPPDIKSNFDFVAQDFYTEDNQHITTDPQVIVDKFKDITGIEERRYLSENMNTSDMALQAGRQALEDSGIDIEQLDQIIVAHNFGDVIKHTFQTDAVPSLAARVKNGLQIKNPNCIAYDLLFGCPGWVQGMINADTFFKAGMAKKALVIGTEGLSRVIDNYDRDSMIFSDGAGAVVVETFPAGETESGILGWSAQTHSLNEVQFINMGKSNYPTSDPDVRYIKMKGRKVYEYAMLHVPLAMKDCLDKSGVSIDQLKKIFIHQANEKMDIGIIQRFYKLYGIKEIPVDVMPMTIHKLGNSSVATIPTLFDLVSRGLLDDHVINSGDVLLFASVGAGMNINAFCYKM
ncbi:MAG: ketoacyl-ACP synthase III [Bacteroidota bacterium]|nr:ketoacyl-ACP synthase III [Bacteroidota bacterium]